MIPRAIAHVFVLMLENRSFDHLLGYAVTPDALPTVVDWQGTASPLKNTLPAEIRPDPPHEADDVYWQLTGNPATAGCRYDDQALTNAGFAPRFADFLARHPALLAQPGEEPTSVRNAVISGYRAAEVPVIASLARDFTVCTRWHASLPGPTWPNRFFAHAGTSGGYYCSPTDWQLLKSTLVSGFAFRRGTIFSALTKTGIPWRVYHGDAFPQVLALKGFDPVRSWMAGQLVPFSKDNDLRLSRDYPYAYTFIEPDYGHDLHGDAGTLFGGGNSQHPVGSIADGEQLISDVYRQIADAGLWESSLLIVTYDEHGGFSDRERDLRIPGFTAALNDDRSYRSLNTAAVDFAFELYGVRVPAVVVSPWLDPGSCATVFDHCTIGRTLGDVFVGRGGKRFAPLTRRMAAAASLAKLPWRATARAMPNLPPVNRTFQATAPPPPGALGIGRPGSAPPRRPREHLESRHFAALALAARARAELGGRAVTGRALQRELDAVTTVTRAKLYLAQTKALIERHKIIAHARRPEPSRVVAPATARRRGRRKTRR